MLLKNDNFSFFGLLLPKKRSNSVYAGILSDKSAISLTIVIFEK